MTREELNNMLTQLGTCEDDAQRRNLITSVTDEVTNIYNANETLTNDNNRYKEDIKNLKSANYDLFLQVQNNGKPSGIIDKTGNEPPKEKRTFENLFDEKGKLK